jgi:hypothetical protein
MERSKPNTEKRNVLVVRKPDGTIKVFGPFETRNQALLWGVQYTSQNREHRSHEQVITELVPPLVDVPAKVRA